MKNNLDGYEIRPLEMADSEKIRIARNEQMNVLRQPHEISKDEQNNYFKNIVIPNSTKPYPEMILYSLFKDNAWIGYGGLTHIDWNNKRAEVSFLVATSRTKNPKTYAHDFNHFLKLLSQEAFKTFQLHRLYTETFDFRNEHIEILENFGFTKEGILREHILLNKTPHDSIMHGLLAKEFTHGL
jgi:RimJ/RimL family protein N-acetyltransferase